MNEQTSKQNTITVGCHFYSFLFDLSREMLESVVLEEWSDDELHSLFCWLAYHPRIPYLPGFDHINAIYPQRFELTGTCKLALQALGIQCVTGAERNKSLPY
jgi:hypothetical protein